MNKTVVSRIFLLAVLLLGIISLMSCGSGGSGSSNVNSQTGSVTAQLHWLEGINSSSITADKQSAAAPQRVATVRIILSGPDMSNIQKDFPASAGTGVIDGVPVGSNRTLTAQGLDASGLVTHQGVKNNITVQPGQTTDAEIVVMYPTGQTFTVSGRVTLNGSGLPGVTVSLQGTSFSTVTGPDGAYSLTGVPNALYTVVPSLAGYTFTPVNRAIPDSNGNVTGQDFSATLIPVQTHTVSGKVTLNGSGLPGVTVSLQGTSFTTVTGSDGAYSLTGVPNGSYTAVPSLTGYTFNPANSSVSVNNSDVAGQDFSATLIPVQTHTVSGRVTLSGRGLSGVTVTLLGTSFSTVTASDGTYTLAGVPNGAYTAVPSLTGYTFNPANSPVSVNNSDVTGQDFAATLSPPLPSGFPSNVPTGNYSITVTACVSGTCASGGSFLLENTDINQFAQALLNALDSSVNQSLGSSCQASGCTCTSAVTSYTPWNGTSFTITDDFSIVCGNSTQTVLLRFTVTKS